MFAYLFVMDPSLLRSLRADGSFSIAGLPPAPTPWSPGTRSWASRKRRVTVGADGSGSTAVLFTAPTE
jgi:hypothetical protein